MDAVIVAHVLALLLAAPDAAVADHEPLIFNHRPAPPVPQGEPRTILVELAGGSARRRSAGKRRPATLQLLGLDGDRLLANVSYAGGCAPHDVRVMASSFIDSYPVKVRLSVVHTTTDRCTTPIDERVVIDLMPLKQAYRRSFGPDGLIDVGLPDQPYSF